MDGATLLQKMNAAERAHAPSSAEQLGMGPYAGYTFAIAGFDRSVMAEAKNPTSSSEAFPEGYVPAQVASSDNFTLFYDQQFAGGDSKQTAKGAKCIRLYP
jgi:hypothetical protein